MKAHNKDGLPALRGGSRPVMAVIKVKVNATAFTVKRKEGPENVRIKGIRSG